ncbi:MAG: response regulator transcription factor [Myxococcales bacterium]|nr:response regulator transcription factor [Myxococcales bacterium]
MKPVRALLVDDDRELARLLSQYLGSHEVTLDHVDDGAQALERLAAGGRGAPAAQVGGAPPADAPTYDIVLLDVMLPGADGFEVCRRIRAAHDVPIVMLTARGEDTDRVVGLELGADDYVPKPFNPRELLARMRAVLRRARPAAPPAPASPASPTWSPPPAGERIVVGDLAIDVPAHQATLGGRELALTSFELRVLIALARRAGETVTREDLAAAVLPRPADGTRYDPSVDRSLDVHVSHLRHKLGDDAREPKRIRTVRGVGYILVRPP